MDFKVDNIEIEEIAPETKPEEKPEKKVVVKKPKKPSYAKGRYTRLPPVKAVNKAIVQSLNGRFLKEKKNKLKLTDCEIGEASLYMVEYYTAIDPFHPALVVMGAVFSLGMKVQELQGGEDA